MKYSLKIMCVIIIATAAALTAAATAFTFYEDDDDTKLTTNADQRPFITTWDVPESDMSIIIPTSSLDHTYSYDDTVDWGGYDPTSKRYNANTLYATHTFVYNYTVDWGDGTIPTQHTEDATHTYAKPGLYTIEISGDFPAMPFFEEIVPQLFYDSKKSYAKIISVDQWGDIKWQSMNSMFAHKNLNITATDVPDLSGVTDMSWMFYSSDLNIDLSTWDTSSVTDMNRMFYDSTFNGDISTWDTSSVTDMSWMFTGSSTFNGDISTWDTSSVTDMHDMFRRNASFNQDISTWDTSSVIYMSQMFTGSSSFNQDISTWDTSSVTDMYQMFAGSAISHENREKIMQSWKPNDELR